MRTWNAMQLHNICIILCKNELKTEYHDDDDGDDENNMQQKICILIRWICRKKWKIMQKKWNKGQNSITL